MTPAECEIIASAGTALKDLAERMCVEAEAIEQTGGVLVMPRSFIGTVMMDVGGVIGLLSALPLEAEGE